MDVDTNVEMRIHCDLLLSREAPRILSSRINVWLTGEVIPLWFAR